MAEAYRIKLIRDRMPEAAPARAFTYRPVEGRPEHIELLRQKLGEEVVEYLVNPSLSELADVLEAVHALAYVDVGLTYAAVDAERLRKREERGGFDRGLVMETVEP